MALWPLDLARVVRQALGSLGVDALRRLLAAACGPNESGGLFVVTGTEVRLAAAAPAPAPFEGAAVRRLAEEACLALEPEPIAVTSSVPDPEWPAALVLPLGDGEHGPGVLVFLARAAGGVSAETRSRASLLAPVLELMLERDAARARAREAEAQLDVARQMLGLTKPGRDLDEVSQAVLDLATRLVDAELGGLWLRPRRGADLDLRAVRHEPDRRPPRPTLEAAEVPPLLGTAPLSCPPGSLALPRKLLREAAIGAAMVAPVHHADELMGLLVVARREGRPPFVPASAERLRELGAVAAVPIVSVALRQELADRTRQLRVNRRIAKGISASLSLDETFRVATRELRRVTAFDVAAIVALDESGEGGQIIVGEPGKAPRIFGWSPELRQTVPGEVMRTGRAALTTDVAAAGRPMLPFLRELGGPRAGLTLPLVVDRETIGALVLVSRPGGRFCRAEGRLLRPAAEQLAIAVRQARLLRAATAGLENRLRLEARLLRAERQATLGRLVGALAHEVRNPLTVIAATVQYLRDRLPPEHEHRQLLEAADRKVREMDESLEGLLTLSRPLELSPAPVDPGVLLEGLAAGVRGRAGRQAVEVAVAAEPALPPILLDRRLMEQALLNLAVCALDAMPEGGRLAVGARLAPETGALVLTVADSGPGIREGDLEELFEPYRALRGRGGLGLAVTRRIVEAHGGAIEAASEPGRGTTFVIVLPAGGVAPKAPDG